VEIGVSVSIAASVSIGTGVVVGVGNIVVGVSKINVGGGVIVGSIAVKLQDVRIRVLRTIHARIIIAPP
jgi:hypothetical protein